MIIKRHVAPRRVGWRGDDLGTAELWEVAGGVITRCAVKESEQSGTRGALLGRSPRQGRQAKRVYQRSESADPIPSRAWSGQALAMLAFMQHPTDWAGPGVDVDFGAAPTQRRLPVHRDPEVGPLPPGQQRSLIASLLSGMTTPAHLGRETVIVALIIVRRETLRPVPTIDTYLRANVPQRRADSAEHQAAPRLACLALCGTALFPRLANCSQRSRLRFLFYTSLGEKGNSAVKESMVDFSTGISVGHKHGQQCRKGKLCREGEMPPPLDECYPEEMRLRL